MNKSRLLAIATCLLAPVLAGTFAIVSAARHAWGWAMPGFYDPHLEFEDLRVVTYTADCVRSIPHWTVESPTCDPWGRAYNYPAGWARTLAFFHLGRADTMWLGFALIVVWVIAAGLLSWGALRSAGVWPRVVLGLALISPPVFFATERGNVDIVVYLFEVVALLLIGTGRWPIGGVILVIAAYLKIFPIAALASLITVRRRIVAFGFILLALVLLATESDGVRHAAKTLPQGTYGAFGDSVYILDHWPHQTANHARLVAIMLVIVLSLIVGALVWRVSVLGAAHSGLVAALEADRLALALFAGGAGMTVVIVLQGTNSDYRLIHLSIIVAALGRVWQVLAARWLAVVLVAVSWASYRFPDADRLGDDVLPLVTAVLVVLLVDLGLRWLTGEREDAALPDEESDSASPTEAAV